MIGARILIVDDEDYVRLGLRQQLQRHGYEVDEAANGKLAVQRYEARRPDLVITDIIMPEQEGIETIIALRKRDPDIKIIAISGGGRTKRLEFLDYARNLGADAVINKPFTAETLMRTIAGVMEPQTTES